jgi:hypothetical protein
VTVISLPHACLASGLLDDARNGEALNWLVLGEFVAKKWQSSVDSFLTDAEKIGITKERVDHTVRDLKGSIIGWTGWKDKQIRHALTSEVGICPDLTITLGILSRRIADIFIPSREPDFSWDKLFGSSFEIDDDSFPSFTLEDDPWKAYQWAVVK